MARYDRHYDYGLRGYRQTALDRRQRGMHTGGYDRDLYLTDRERPRGPLPNRVTARYNRDYVTGPSGDEIYRRNPNMFGGDRIDRVGDLRYFRQPYTTIGGTNTFRGSRNPIGYDRDFDDFDRDFSHRF